MMAKMGKSWQSKRVPMLIFVVVMAAIGSYLVWGAMAAPSKGAVPSLYVLPASQTVPMSSELTLQVWEDSTTQPVNAVQADLVYAADKFDFVRLDATGSAFSVEAPSSGGNGTVSIVRGHPSGLTGKQFVATVVLKPKVSSGKTSVLFANTSALLSSLDNKNILQRITGGRYTLAP